MKAPLLLHTVLFLGGSIVFAGCQYNNASVLPFIRRVTKVSLPDKMAIISQFDQGDLEAGGKYRLEQKDVGRLLSNYPFHPIDQQYLYSTHFNLMGKAGLFPLSDSIPLSEKSRLKYFYGCKDGNDWLFTLNEKSGELWIEIQYPDSQGQGPACKI